MNYSALIENRKSVRAFTNRQVAYKDLAAIAEYYRKSVRRLVPEIETEVFFFGPDSRAALEGAAGYNQFLVGAPQYMVLLGLLAMYLNGEMALTSDKKKATKHKGEM